ncbi:hypothetical protein [Streptomyces sp. NPDC054784]
MITTTPPVAGERHESDPVFVPAGVAPCTHGPGPHPHHEATYDAWGDTWWLCLDHPRGSHCRTCHADTGELVREEACPMRLQIVAAVTDADAAEHLPVWTTAGPSVCLNGRCADREPGEAYCDHVLDELMCACQAAARAYPLPACTFTPATWPERTAA